MSHVIVIGSANVDQVYSVHRIPAPGETVLSSGFTTARGGKGQNQAVAAARAGAPTVFIAAVGDDAFGDLTLQGLAADGIDASLVRRVPAPTGTASIAVDAAGENAIIVEAGANRLLTGLTSDDAAALAAASVLVMQLEIPLATVEQAAAHARAADTTVLLNAAPASDLPEALLADVDVLVVNEHEAAHLAGDRGIESLVEVVPVVIVTLGDAGAVLYQRGETEVAVPAPRVRAVDATGAGDTFCGALAAALAESLSLDAAVRFAVVAASISVQEHGAVPSIPRRAAIDSANTR